MMGQPQPQKDLFSYRIDLDQRVRPDHPLRAIKAAVDFTFVRDQVAHCYGYNGNESVPPEVILKLMFLLFYDNLASERELMRVLPERLDYLWFLDFGLDDPIPDHSVLSKARKRWGAAVFEQFFVRTVGQCVAAGLVDIRGASEGSTPDIGHWWGVSLRNADEKWLSCVVLAGGFVKLQQTSRLALCDCGGPGNVRSSAP